MPKFALLFRAPAAAVAAALALCAAPALADRPMMVDEVGTPEVGEAKLEFGLDKDGKARGWEFVAGFAPLANVELELELERARDRENDPTMVAWQTGISAKWVPLQPKTGLAAGLKVDYGRARFDDRTHRRVHERGTALTALLGWRFANESALHLNLGREWVRASGNTDEANTWGVAFVQPVGESLELIAEFAGVEDTRPDRQIGLRYEIVEGVKLSGAVGRGSDRNKANVGVSWEF